MTAAAFEASYSDWKLIKTRGVVQIVLEIPIEKSHQAYEVLGGMPAQDQSIWCAVARLQNTGEAPGPSTLEAISSPSASASPRGEPVAGARASPVRRPFSTLQLPQQCALLCDDARFRRFLKDYDHGDFGTKEETERYLKSYLKVGRKRDILPNTWAGNQFITLRGWYEAWKMEAAA